MAWWEERMWIEKLNEEFASDEDDDESGGVMVTDLAGDLGFNTREINPEPTRRRRDPSNNETHELDSSSLA